MPVTYYDTRDRTRDRERRLADQDEQRQDRQDREAYQRGLSSRRMSDYPHMPLTYAEMLARIRAQQRPGSTAFQPAPGYYNRPAGPSVPNYTYGESRGYSTPISRYPEYKPNPNLNYWQPIPTFQPVQGWQASPYALGTDAYYKYGAGYYANANPAYREQIKPPWMRGKDYYLRPPDYQWMYQQNAPLPQPPPQAGGGYGGSAPAYGYGGGGGSAGVRRNINTPRWIADLVNWRI